MEQTMNLNNLTDEEKRNRLHEIIQESLEKRADKDSDGSYYVEIYADYRDEMSEETIKEILSSDNPWNAFHDTLFEFYLDSDTQELNYLRKMTALDLEDNEEAMALIEDLDYDMDNDLYEYIQETVFVKLPEDHYLKQDTYINIVMDTGDANYDFTKNNLANYYADMYWPDELELPDYSSLIWLARQQGFEDHEILSTLQEGYAFSLAQDRVLNKKAELEKALHESGKDKHTGYLDQNPYQRYMELRPKLEKLNHELALLEEKFERNSISYEDYAKTYLNPKGLEMSEETFLKEQKSILDNTAAKIHACKENLQKIHSEIKANPELENVKTVYEEYRQFMQKEYKEMVNTDDYKRSRFLESFLAEAKNLPSHMGALAFCVNMPLEQAINIKELMNKEKECNNSYTPEERTGNSFLVLDKNTTCGLYDAWSGSGSIFELSPVQDIEIPLKFIHNFNVDGSIGYSIGEIYGVDGSFWSDNAVKAVIEMEPEKGKRSFDEILKEAKEKPQPKQKESEPSFHKKEVSPDREH